MEKDVKTMVRLSSLCCFLAVQKADGAFLVFSNNGQQMVCDAIPSICAISKLQPPERVENTAARFNFPNGSTLSVIWMSTEDHIPSGYEAIMWEATV